ncbi:MAG: LysR family transcriptional regulator [Chloroflexi bacterium]|nr:LysR family transcriptional regulator [Chloroflexota bacterium]
MELRHLRYFVAVAEERHFGRAAAKLGMSQPPLSQQIQQLEGELGVQLLWRSTRRVELTHAGEVFLDHARRLLSQSDEAVQAARRAGRQEIGQLRLGYVTTAGVDTLPALLERYHHEMPQIEVSLHSLPSAEQIAELEKGELDVALVRAPVTSRQLQTLTLRRDPFVALLPPNHPLASHRQVALPELVDEPFVLWPSGSHMHDQVMQLCHDAGFEPKVVKEADAGLLHSIVGLVAAGMGVSIIAAAARGWASNSVACKPLAGLKTRAPLMVVWRRDDTSPAVGAFVALAKPGLGMGRGKD